MKTEVSSLIFIKRDNNEEVIELYAKLINELKELNIKVHYQGENSIIRNGLTIRRVLSDMINSKDSKPFIEIQICKPELKVNKENKLICEEYDKSLDCINRWSELNNLNINIK